MSFVVTLDSTNLMQLESSNSIDDVLQSVTLGARFKGVAGVDLPIHVRAACEVNGVTGWMTLHVEMDDDSLGYLSLEIDRDEPAPDAQATECSIGEIQSLLVPFTAQISSLQSVVSALAQIVDSGESQSVEELKRISPSNDQLRAWARNSHPPEYLSGKSEPRPW